MPTNNSSTLVFGKSVASYLALENYPLFFFQKSIFVCFQDKLLIHLLSAANLLLFGEKQLPELELNDLQFSEFSFTKIKSTN